MPARVYQPPSRRARITGAGAAHAAGAPIIVAVHRFFAPSLDPGDEAVDLPRDEAEHLTRVLRLGVGDTIAVFDGRGREYLARVVSAQRRSVRVQSTAESAVTSPQATPSGNSVVVFCGAGPRASSSATRGRSGRSLGRRSGVSPLTAIQLTFQPAGLDLAHEAVVDGVRQAIVGGARVGFD